MAVTYLYDKQKDEKLIEYVRNNIPKEFKKRNIKFVVTDNVSDLMSFNKNDTKFQILITTNCSKEFVKQALEYTDFIIYKSTDYEEIMNRVLKILGKNLDE